MILRSKNILGRPKLIENGKKMVFYVEEELEKNIKKIAQQQDLSPSQLIRKILKEYLENK